MNIKFSPVPVEDRERGRNGNCYNPGSPLTEGMKKQFMEEIKPICIVETRSILIEYPQNSPKSLAQ